MKVLADPVQGLQVAKAAFALFDVGLQHIALAALPAVPLGPLGQLRLDELGAGVAEQVVPQPLSQVFGQWRVAGDEAMLQQGGPDRDVFPAQPQAVLHGPAGVTHLQPQVPQHVEHAFDDRFSPGGDLPRGEKQQIDIGMRGHFGPAVSAHGQNGDAFGFSRVCKRVQKLHGDQQRGGHQGICQVRLGAHQRPRLARMAGKGGGKRGVGAQAQLGKVAHRNGTGLAWLGVAPDLGRDGGDQGLGIGKGSRHV